MPETIRDTSSMSSISWACSLALRSMVSRRAVETSPSSRPVLSMPGPAEDGVERRAQLVREQAEELVLRAAGDLGLLARGLLALEESLALLDRALSVLIEPGVVHGDRGLGGEPLDDPFVPRGEDARLGVTEEESAQNLARPRGHGDRQVAGHRQVARGHAVIGRSPPYRGSFLTSSMRIVPSPRKVGPNRCVARGIGKCSKASRGTPDRV